MREENLNPQGEFPAFIIVAGFTPFHAPPRSVRLARYRPALCQGQMVETFIANFAVSGEFRSIDETTNRLGRSIQGQLVIR